MLRILLSLKCKKKLRDDFVFCNIINNHSSDACAALLQSWYLFSYQNETGSHAFSYQGK